MGGKPTIYEPVLRLKGRNVIVLFKMKIYSNLLKVNESLMAIRRKIDFQKMENCTREFQVTIGKILRNFEKMS